MKINGYKISKEILSSLKKTKIPKRKIVALASQSQVKKEGIFLEIKKKFAEKLNINFQTIIYKSNSSRKKIIELIKKLSDDNTVGGIIIQLPLKNPTDQKIILDYLPFEKDIDCIGKDCLSNYYCHTLCKKQDFSIEPPAVRTLRSILKKTKFSINRKKILLIGKGFLVGKPILAYLLKYKVSLWVVASEAKKSEINQLSKKADLVISGVGKKFLVENIKKGGGVIDFGISFSGGKIFGDCQCEKIKTQAKFYTPTPGGTGPILVANLFRNFYTLNTH